MASIPSVDESLLTTPTGAGERKGLPRNLHWILMGILLLVLAVVILGAAVEKEAETNTKKAEKETDSRQAAIGISAPADPRGILAIQEVQEAKVAPAITTHQGPAKLPPVPETPDAVNGEGVASERLRAEQQKQEAITASPILALRGQMGRMAGGSGEGGALTPEEQLMKERDAAIAAVTSRGSAARSSAGGLFGQTGNSASPGGSGGGMMGGGSGIPGSGMSGGGGVSGSARNQQWLQSQANMPNDTQSLRVAYPSSQSIVSQGAIIPVVLVTALNSDMPGQVVAMTTSDVYDSIRGENLIIPRGSKLYGMYSAEVQIGQERALAAFQRLVRPDGSYVNLQGMPGADGIGQSGIPGDVNNHFFKMFGTSFIIAGLAHIFDKNRNQVPVTNNGTASGGSFSGATGEILVDVAKRVSQRNTNLMPTITVPAGEKFTVTVTKDIDIPPYRHRLPGQ